MRCSVARRAASCWTRPVGEGGLLLRFGMGIDEAVSEQVLACLAALDESATKPVGVRDVLPAYASLLVHFDPLLTTNSDVEAWCLGVASEAAEAAAAGGAAAAAEPPRLVTIPVAYGGEHGPDIDVVAGIAGLGSTDAVVEAHSSADYRVFFLGFTAGFPYLGGLPSSLGGVPRLETPRQTVPKGAVGIAAGQTGVYTVSSPGGWHLLGQTALALFDPAQDPPALLRAGDRVKFTPVAAADVAVKAEAEAEAVANGANAWVDVLAPGPQTTVQDLGRRGYARHGVSRTGAADGLALQMGNALVGNARDAAGLEVAMGGLHMKCVVEEGTRGCAVALTGADCNAILRRAEGGEVERLRVNEVSYLRRDDVLELGFASDGSRAYVCVEGGVDSMPVLGSRSTDLRATLGGHGGRPLREGDRLSFVGADPDAAAPALHRAVHDPLRDAGGRGSGSGSTWELRVLPGPGDPATAPDSATLCGNAALLSELVGAEFDVLPRSDRMAVCVSTSCETKLEGGEQMSEACVSGTVQVPPDGNPVILLAEHQTTGGYKVPAIVVEADLWKVGQMRPGDRMRFVSTTEADAVAALRRLTQRATETESRPIDSSQINLAVLASAPNQMVHDFNAEPSMTALVGPDGALASSDTDDERYTLKPRSGAALRCIDLNADCGEGFDDAGLLQYVTSVNIACGGHVGTPESIAKTVALAAERGAGIGAHVSFPDREDFGRRALDTSPLELRDQVLWQASALAGLCLRAGARVSYIKPHGALYHAVMAGGEQGQAVRDAAQLLELPLLLMPRSPWATFGEGFAERAYDGDALRSREKEGALIHDPAEAAQQAIDLANGNADLHSICVHGDSPDAVTIARAVRSALEGEGYRLRPFIEKG